MLSNLRKTTQQRLDMKRRTPDWAGYSANPPPLRRKTGIATGKCWENLLHREFPEPPSPNGLPETAVSLPADSLGAQ